MSVRTRRYQRGTICRSANGEIWYGKYYPLPGAPQKRVQLGRTEEMDEKQARVALDDIVAALNKNPAHALGAEPIRRFVEQVFIPQKYEDGIWRDNTGREAEYIIRNLILPEIGELRCRDLKADHLRNVLRKRANAGHSREYVNKVRFALGDIVRSMMAHQYVAFDVAAGLKTPAAARPSDRSRLRRVTLGEYRRVWTVLEERERLAFDLTLFCGMRESEVYGLKNGDLQKRGLIRIERSWYKGKIEPPKNDRPRNVGVDDEIFDRLVARIETLPDSSRAGWLFPSERIVTPLRADNVLRRDVDPHLEPLGLDWINFAVLRRTHSTLHQQKGTDPKIIADQQGHGLGVHMSEYVDSSLAEKQAASSALWADFKTTTSENQISN